MWLIRLGKVTSVVYLVFTWIFVLMPIFIMAAADPAEGTEPPDSRFLLLIPISWTIPWSANRLRKRLFEDVNFDRRDWIYYPSITIGSWVLLLVSWFLISLWVFIR